jgi:hypothetical protein
MYRKIFIKTNKINIVIIYKYIKKLITNDTNQQQQYIN